MTVVVVMVVLVVVDGVNLTACRSKGVQACDTRSGEKKLLGGEEASVKPGEHPRSFGAAGEISTR